MRRLGSLVALLACAGCAAILGEPIESSPVPARPVAAPPAAPVTATGATTTPTAPPAAEAPKPRRGRMQGDTRPESYVVERGDTLFGIALDFGLDYRELAGWNGIPDPARIRVGQRLRLMPPDAPDEPQVRPLTAPGATEVESLGPSTGSAEAGAGTAAAGAGAAGTGAAEAAVVAAEKVPVLSEPRAATLPWSEKAFAQLGGDLAAAKALPERKAEGKPDAKADARPEGRTDPRSDGKSEARPDPKADPKTDAKGDAKTDSKQAARGDTPPASRPEARPDAKPSTSSPPSPATASKPAESASPGDDWVWPARGSLAYRFGDSGALKGLGIAGKAGSPVVAAAPGRVVYSGSGLRGYGKLVIIKHGEEYLTVYAHNRTLLVKEGEQVKRGQRIAEMGDTDSDRVALHFELRRFGKPVDPLSQLPGERPPG